MALDCLKGLIGVKAGEVTPEPVTGLYVTSLPDINLVEIGKIADSDQLPGEGQKDWTKLWLDVENRGILKFRTLFLSEINRCFRISNITIAECLICENKELLAVSLWYLLGAELMFERINSNRINRYTTIDKSKAKELRADLMELFHSELSTAVAGIDINNSTCMEDSIIEERNLITTHTPVI
ncbi:MAG: hypothetical protein JXQ69_03765 [Paludibacteraceae bacterium]|nr:hypothetical protein [Paludibacteraceae bacterium]